MQKGGGEINLWVNNGNSRTDLNKIFKKNFINNLNMLLYKKHSHTRR